MRPMRLVALAAALIAVAAPLDDLLSAHLDVNSGVEFDMRMSRENSEIGASGHGITEIAIGRGGGRGPKAGWYTASLSSDGTAKKESSLPPGRKGVYEGVIHELYFNELAWLVKRSGYLELEHTYRVAGVDHQATVITSVTHEDGRKVISNSGSAGPTELWAVEMVIDAVLEKVQWTRKGSTRR